MRSVAGMSRYKRVNEEEKRNMTALYIPEVVSAADYKKKNLVRS